jgi:hypothetical protein
MALALLSALWLGASSAGLTLVLRYAPGLSKINDRGTRPLACDVCMSLWTTLILWILAYGYDAVPLLAWPPSFAVAKLVLTRISDPVSAPPLPGQWEEVEKVEPLKSEPPMIVEEGEASNA